MTINYPKFPAEGLSLAGVPYLSQSTLTLGETLKFSFGTIAQRISVRNNGGTSGRTIAVAFSSDGLSNGRFTVLDDGESFSGNFRCQELFVSGAAGGSTTVEVAAELTPVNQSQMRVLSASNLKYKGYFEV